MLTLVDYTAGKIGAYLQYIAAALLIIVSALIAVDVIMRSVLNAPIIGVAEIVANGIVIIAFLQLTYTIRIGAMLRSELLVSLLPKHMVVFLEAFVAILGALFFGLLCWASYEPMMNAIARGEFEGHATFQVPTWPVKSIIVVCSALAVLTYCLAAWRALAGVDAPGTPSDRLGSE